MIDVRDESFANLSQSADAVIDTVGGKTQASLFDVVKPGGVVVSAVSPPHPQLAQQRGVRALFFLVEVTTARLIRLAEMFDAGALQTTIAAILPLSEAAAAHEMLEGLRPRGRGKIVLRIDEPSESTEQSHDHSKTTNKSIGRIYLRQDESKGIAHGGRQNRSEAERTLRGQRLDRTPRHEREYFVNSGKNRALSLRCVHEKAVL